jgi:hypothetical protein
MFDLLNSSIVDETTSIICSNCDDKSEALYTCRQCKETLCSECNKAHSRLTLTRNHNATVINDIANIVKKISV